MKKQQGFTIIELVTALVTLAIVVGGVWGWIWNIIRVVAIANDPITGMFILRVVGIPFAPLGAILGFM